MQKAIEELNNEIDDCNKYLRKKNDFGATHRKDDPLEFISFTRGKSVGLVIGRDKIKSIYPEFLTKIDWKLLRKQKITLSSMIYQHSHDKWTTENLTGLMHLIDALQDYATDEMGMSDKEVFNLTPEEE